MQRLFLASLFLLGPFTVFNAFGAATPLGLAVSKRDAEAVWNLIEAGADVNQKSDGNLPLVTAVKNGDPEIVEALVSHGAKTRVKDRSGQSAIEVLSSLGGARDVIADAICDEIDLRKSGYSMEHVRVADQGDFGSCFMQVAMKRLESELKMKGLVSPDFEFSSQDSIVRYGLRFKRVEGVSRMISKFETGFTCDAFEFLVQRSCEKKDFERHLNPELLQCAGFADSKFIDTLVKDYFLLNHSFTQKRMKWLEVEKGLRDFFAAKMKKEISALADLEYKSILEQLEDPDLLLSALSGSSSKQYAELEERKRQKEEKLGIALRRREMEEDYPILGDRVKSALERFDLMNLESHTEAQCLLPSSVSADAAKMQSLQCFVLSTIDDPKSALEIFLMSLCEHPLGWKNHVQSKCQSLQPGDPLFVPLIFEEEFAKGKKALPIPIVVSMRLFEGSAASAGVADRPDHAVLVVGRKRVGGSCHYIIRNSWGAECENSKWPCDRGDLLIPKGVVAEEVISVDQWR